MRVYPEKPVVLLSTSIGRGGAANVLNTAVMSGQFFGYEVEASLAVPTFHENFDVATGSLVDTDLDQQLRTALATLRTHRGEHDGGVPDDIGRMPRPDERHVETREHQA